MNNQSFQRLSYLIILALIIAINCDGISDSVLEENSNDKIEGLNIYRTNIDISSDLTYQIFSLDSANLSEEPILYYDQILSYDTTLHIITLSFTRDSLFKKIGAVGVYGKAFIVTLESQKIYGGWFWTPISSIPCQSVVIESHNISNNLLNNEIKIKLGYPSQDEYIGIDPRNNQKIIKKLIEDKKAK